MTRLCQQCNIVIGQTDATYHAYDATLCSISCRDNRCKYIYTIDPTHMNPDRWILKYTKTELTDQYVLNRLMLYNEARNSRAINNNHTNHTNNTNYTNYRIVMYAKCLYFIVTYYGSALYARAKFS